jgi:2-haloacid dehalogenase
LTDKSIKALVFDAYGTLFDVHSVVALGERLYPGKGGQLSQLWRAKQLEYTWLRSLMGRYEDFAAVTRAGLEYACKTLQLPLDAHASAQLMASYNNLALYPDAREALAGLSGLKLAILSNGAPAMLGPLVKNAGLEKTFAAVISVDEVKIFKPSPRVYQLAPDRLGVAAHEIGFVSSNYWDAAGAKSFGFNVFWINRAGAQPDMLGAAPDAVLALLTELPARIG